MIPAFILPFSVHILVASSSSSRCSFPRRKPTRGLSAKLRVRHEGDDALSNVRSGRFKATPTVEMKKKEEGEEEATESPLRNLTFCSRAACNGVIETAQGTCACGVRCCNLPYFSNPFWRTLL